MTQARDLADGKFDTNTLVVDAANNRVGVGTASPSTNLDITGSGGQVTVDANGHITSKQSLDAATAGGRIIGASNRGTVSQIDLAQTTSSADGGYIRFLTCDSGSTNPTERMRLLSGGGLTFNGDTAAANALDDYEEGTFTPNFTGVGGGEASYSTREGSYTKIGRLVVANVNMNLSSRNTLSGAVRINNLPFTVANLMTGTSVQANGSVAYFAGLSASVSSMVTFPVAGTINSQFHVVSGTSGTSMGSLTTTDITDSFNFRATVTYFTT